MYDFVVTLVAILNFIIIIVKELEQKPYEESLTRTAFVINFIIMFEWILDIAVHGPVNAFKFYFRVWPESVC